MEDNTQDKYLQGVLNTLTGGVAQAASARLGSFSERNPLLGKMTRCPHCRKRRRQNIQIPCCNAKHIVENLKSKPFGKTDGALIPMTPKAKGRKNPRLTRNRPPLFLMRQILLDLESDPEKMALRVALIQDDVDGQVHGKNSKWGHTPQKEIAPAHVAAFIEKVITREMKLSAKRKRQIQKESRRRNRC